VADLASQVEATRSSLRAIGGAGEHAPPLESSTEGH